MAERLRHRLYQDFALPDRLDEYRMLLERAAELGYRFHTVGSYFAAQRDRTLEARVLVLRCDVDTDPGTAAAKFEILTRVGGRGSFFFRLGTLDVDLMRRIEASGSEASYHYEEVATVAKELGLKSREAITRRRQEIVERFRENLVRLRSRTGLPMVVLAAHGDWINRRLDVSNKFALTRAVRRELGILVEAYDAAAVRGITSRISDTSYPQLWKPAPPAPALERGDAVVYVLTHPRQWRRSIRANLSHDTRRVVEELRFRAAAPSQGRL